MNAPLQSRPPAAREGDTEEGRLPAQADPVDHPALESEPIRAGLNQTRRREANERIEAQHPGSAFAEFVCECTQATCDAPVYMTIEEYETVRAASTRFVVTPDHAGEAERAVIQTSRFSVIEKIGDAGTLAQLLDRRTRSSTD